MHINTGSNRSCCKSSTEQRFYIYLSIFAFNNLQLSMKNQDRDFKSNHNRTDTEQNCFCPIIKKTLNFKALPYNLNVFVYPLLACAFQRLMRNNIKLQFALNMFT